MVATPPSPTPAGSNGATVNAAFMALMYADMVESTAASSAHVYKCWGLSQVRYMLGDAGHSLVVGVGKDPPKRTQDRAAGCPEPPQVRPCSQKASSHKETQPCRLVLPIMPVTARWPSQALLRGC